MTDVLINTLCAYDYYFSNASYESKHCEFSLLLAKNFMFKVLGNNQFTYMSTRYNVLN